MDYRSARVVVPSTVLGLLLIMSALAFGAPVVAQTGLDLDISLTTATVTKGGVVTISGAVTCSGAATTTVTAALTQPAGRKAAITGFASQPLSCAGPDVRSFALRLVGSNGRFNPGTANLSLTVFGCSGTGPYPGPLPSCDNDASWPRLSGCSA